MNHNSVLKISNVVSIVKFIFVKKNLRTCYVRQWKAVCRSGALWILELVAMSIQQM